MQTYQQQAKHKLLATIVTIVVIAGLVVVSDHLKAEKAESTRATPISATNSTVTPVTSTSTSSTSTASSGTYKDGTYTAASQYFVPSGHENISVTVTLKDGVITNSSIVNSEGDRDSARYQQDFASVYKSYVVGKKINEVHLSFVAGASDTTDGFNEAISQITQKAQA